VAKGKIELILNPDGRDYAYVSLPAHAGNDPADLETSLKLRNRHVHLLELMPDYKGAGIAFEFDANGEIIGISIFPD
jgi:hypothetical protein